MFFRNANAGAPPGAAYQSPLGLTAAPQLSSLVGAQPNVEKLVEDHLAVQSLIRAYQVHTLPMDVDVKCHVAMVMFCFYSFPFATWAMFYNGQTVAMEIRFPIISVTVK